MEWKDIINANTLIKSVDIKGKDYAQVKERIKAFRSLVPNGTISTELVSVENGVCIFKASVYDGDRLLGTGYAYEKENSSYINKTSYIENCETSAVGRALGMCGLGIDTSLASYEEVTNAVNNQKKSNDRQKIAPFESQNLEELQQLVSSYYQKYKGNSFFKMNFDDARGSAKSLKEMNAEQCNQIIAFVKANKNTLGG